MVLRKQFCHQIQRAHDMHILSSDLSKMNTVNGNSLCVCGEKTTQVTRFPPYNSYALIWAPKNWSFWIVVLEKTLESPLDCKEIQPVHSEGDQPWDYFGRNDAKAEAPVLWPPHAKSWLIREDSDAGRDWGQEEKGMTEDEMAGWHHWLNGREEVWVNSRTWWCTGKPGVLRLMG